MPEYMFILGKNPELSMAEIVSYLDSRGIEFSMEDHARDFLVITAENLPKTAPSDLGGILKFGEVLSSYETRDDLLNSLESLDWEKITKGLPDKPLFAVSSYDAGHAEEFMQKIKKNLKAMDIKAGMLSHKSLTVSHTEIIRRCLERREFLFCRGKRWWLGRTLSAHNPFEFQKRDVNRPQQRIKLSMPPRLARIMLNISGKPGRVLDPFCGLGTVLQEAALLGFEAHGSDVDEEIVEKCKQNMDWFKKRYKIKKLPEIRRADARNLPWPDGHFDAVVTEPVLGPTLKKYPKARQAEAIIRKLEPLYKESFKEMVRVLKKGRRLVLTSPMFRVHNQIYRLRIEDLAKDLEAKEIDPLEGRLPHTFPLTDFEPRHRTLREIHVIEK